VISCTGSQSVKESSTKLGVLVYKFLHGAVPSYMYLVGMISPVGNGSQRLRSVVYISDVNMFLILRGLLQSLLMYFR